MVITEQMEKAVERQNAQLGLFGVARLAGLTAGDAGGDDDVTKKPGLGTRDSVLCSLPLPTRSPLTEMPGHLLIGPCAGIGD